MEEAFTALLGSPPAVQLLNTISNNIVGNPLEPKYRRLRPGNATLSILFGAPGGRDLLAAIGFLPEGAEFVVLPPGALLPPAFLARLAAAQAPAFGASASEHAARMAAAAAKREVDRAEKARTVELAKQDQLERRAAEALRGAPKASVATPMGAGGIGRVCVATCWGVFCLRSALSPSPLLTPPHSNAAPKE